MRHGAKSYEGTQLQERIPDRRWSYLTARLPQNLTGRFSTAASCCSSGHRLSFGWLPPCPPRFASFSHISGTSVLTQSCGSSSCSARTRSIAGREQDENVQVTPPGPRELPLEHHVSRPSNNAQEQLATCSWPGPPGCAQQPAAGGLFALTGSVVPAAAESPMDHTTRTVGCSSMSVDQNSEQ